jgi:hypothetical protein
MLHGDERLLQGHPALQPLVDRFVDHAHAALTDHMLYEISVVHKCARCKHRHVPFLQPLVSRRALLRLASPIVGLWKFVLNILME